MITNPHAKRVLCYGDSLTFGKVPGENRRWGPNERWTGVLQSLLGDEYEIIEEGERSRTTNIDDHDLIARNGLTHFYATLLSHSPLDLIILFLGTNDTKERFNRSPEQIALALNDFKTPVKFTSTYLGDKEPMLLIISPPMIIENVMPKEWGFVGSEEKIKHFPELFEKAAKEMNAEFLDISKVVTPSEVDGVHLDVENNKKLAEALKAKIEELRI